MAIKAYVGVMGSGKTYEVVSVVIYNALKTGRRVVSNIAGLNFEEIKGALIAEGVEESAIGELVCVPHEKILDPLFWRTDEDDKLGIDAFIQPGDVIALDEIWRFWDGLGLKFADGRGRRPERVMNFVRMHRQMTQPKTGVSCDLAIITQDPADVHRSIKGVIEETYQMTKLTVVGQENRYRVDVFHRTRMTRAPMRSFFREYDPKKFSFYKSHSQAKAGAADAKEINIDDRGNVLKGGLFKFVLPLMALLGIIAVWFLLRFFNPPKDKDKAPEAAASGQVASATTAAGESAPGAKSDKKKLDVSDDWRLIDWFTNKSSDVSILAADAQSRTRSVYDPPGFRVRGWSSAVKLPEGDMITFYSGQAPTKRDTPAMVKP